MVLYILLAGEPPFEGDTREDLFEGIQSEREVQLSNGYSTAPQRLSDGSLTALGCRWS